MYGFNISAFNAQDQTDVRRIMLHNFEQLFPRYAWKEQSFKISYTFENTNFTIERYKESVEVYFKLKFTYSDNFKRLYNKIIRQVRRLDKDKSIKSEEINSEIIKYINDTLYSSGLFQDRDRSISTKILFIPASRTLFVKYFTTNIFSFLSNSFDLDPLIINFGSN